MTEQQIKDRRMEALRELDTAVMDKVMTPDPNYMEYQYQRDNIVKKSMNFIQHLHAKPTTEGAPCKPPKP